MPETDEVDVFEIVMNQPRTGYRKRLSLSQLQTLKKFDNHNKIRNLTKTTRHGSLDLITRLGADVQKDYKNMTAKDVNDWLDRNIKPSSRVEYQRKFHKFFTWLGKNPKKWFVKIENAESRVIDPSEIWSPQEVFNLVKAYSEIQYRALVMTLFDSEGRVSELCSVCIKDVEFKAGNASVFFPESKTKRRRIDLLFSAKDLLDWYNIRKAQAKSLDEPLWLSKCNRNRNQRLTPSGVTEILKYGCKLLGTKKRLHPHLLRHSMASYLRRLGFPDALHRIRMGISENSTVLNRYTHFTDTQVFEAAKKAIRIKTDEPVKEAPNPLIGVNCPRCGTINRISDTLCYKCWLSLDLENSSMEYELLEMFRSRFTKAAELDKLFKQYLHFKEDLVLLESFKQLIVSSKEINTDIVKRYFVKTFKLTDEGINYFLESLVNENVVEIRENIIIVDSENLDKLIQVCKDFLEVDDKYKVSKE